MVKWKDKFEPNILLDQIVKGLSLSGHGISFTPDVPFYIDLLFSQLKHDYEQDSGVLLGLFETVIFDEFKKNKKIPSASIPKLFKNLCDRKFLKKRKYSLVTSIGVDGLNTFNSIEIDGCYLRFYNSIPKKYLKSRKNLIQRYDILSDKAPDVGSYVVVSVTANDEKTAFKKALSSLDVFRAIFQLTIKLLIRAFASTKSEEYFTESVPFLGYVHSLHSPDGKAATNLLWYEEGYQSRPSSKLKTIEKSKRGVVRLVNAYRKSHFKVHLKDALMSYIGARDHKDSEFRFLRLWTCLEKLFNTDDSKTLISRLVFFHENRLLHQHILSLLRTSRNVQVHTGNTPLNIEMKNYLMVSYLETSFRYFLFNAFNYKTLDDFIKFISQNTNPDSIEQQLRNLKTVKKFLSLKG